MLKIMLLIIPLLLNVIIVRAGPSLSFAIDITGSMGEEIDQVKLGVSGIMDIIHKSPTTQVEDMVLVTFADPDTDMKIKTRKPDLLISELESIVPGNNHNPDWPEYSLSGIELALKCSEPNSYMFVFTDASAKDYFKSNYIKRECQLAQVQITFILTDYCIDDNDKKCLVYHDIASACSGQVFIVNKNEIEKVIDYVKETINGQKSLLKTIEVPANSNSKVDFVIDDDIQYALLSAAGEHVTITIEGPSNNYTRVLSSDNTQVLRLENPVPGKYWAIVNGSSRIKLQIFGRTDFVFEHGFSKVIPKSLLETAKQPIADGKDYLAISVTDPDHKVQIEMAEIWDMDNNLLANLSLKLIGDLYLTEPFNFPEEQFKISVQGKVLESGNNFRRFSKTPIESQNPEVVDAVDTFPVTNITDGPLVRVSYEDKLRLSCSVYAYPTPEITWMDENGNNLTSESSPVELPYKFISYLSLDGIKKNSTYFCKASNKWTTTNRSVIVEVSSPFNVVSHPAANPVLHYGKEGVLQCHVASDFPMRIDWFRMEDGVFVQLQKSLNDSISINGTELKYDIVSLDAIKQHRCKAVLTNDPTQFMEFTMDVNVTVDNFAPITIIINSSYYVPYGNDIELMCTVLAFPKPNIVWMDANGEILESQIRADSQNPTYYESFVTIMHINSSNSYVCEASNEISTSNSTIDVIVDSPFSTNDTPPANTSLDYGKEGVLRCNVKSSFPMRIDWFWEVNEENVQLNSSDNYTISSDGTELKIKYLTLDLAGKYTCKAVLIDNPREYKEYTTDVTVTSDKNEIPVISYPTDLKPSNEIPLELPQKQNTYITVSTIMTINGYVSEDPPVVSNQGLGPTSHNIVQTSGVGTSNKEITATVPNGVVPMKYDPVQFVQPINGQKLNAMSIKNNVLLYFGSRYNKV